MENKDILTFLNVWLPHDPAILLLGPRELKIYVHVKTCMQMFMAMFFIIVKNWKLPNCPTNSEHVGKLGPEQRAGPQARL